MQDGPAAHTKTGTVQILSLSPPFTRANQRYIKCPPYDADVPAIVRVHAVRTCLVSGNFLVCPLEEPT